MRRLLKRLLANEKGFTALFTAFLVSLILAPLLAGTVTLSTSSHQLAKFKNSQTTALYVAESGINHALWNLSTSMSQGGHSDDPSWRPDGTTFQWLEADQSKFSIKVEDGPDEAELTITSTGVAKATYGSGWVKRTVRVVAKRETGIPPGIISTHHLTISGGALVDSYNSSLGSYEPTNPGSNGNIFTNSSLSLTGNVKVSGDATALDNVTITGSSRVEGNVKTNGSLSMQGGTQVDGDVASAGSVDLNPSAQVLGSLNTNRNISMGWGSYLGGNLTYGRSFYPRFGTVRGTISQLPNTVSLLDPITLDPVPDFNTGSTNVRLTSGSRTIYPGYYQDISVSGDGRLTLTSGTYYIASLKTSGAGVLILNNTFEPVKIYLSRYFKISGGALVNRSGKPTELIIISAGTYVKISGGASFSGVVYGPEAKIEIVGGGEVFGAFVGKRIENHGGAKIHYDEATEEAEGITTGQKMRVISWEEVR